MEIVKFIYQDSEIEFEVANENVKVNATEMAKIFNKYPKDFLILDSTKAFIISCLKKENSPFLNIVNEDDLYTSNQKTGTWMHRILALKFAAWLNPDFELWVYYTIDKLINSHFRAQREALIEKLSAKQKKELKKQEILTKYPELIEIQEYFQLEHSEKIAAQKRLSAIRNQVKQMKIEFNF